MAMSRRSSRITTTDRTRPPPSFDQTDKLPHTSHSLPYLPTKLELLLLLIYPFTLVLGSIFSTLAPHIPRSGSAYSAQHQSYYPPSLAPSYFAQKRNVFNVYFVKKGWFWTTLALVIFIFTHPSLGRPLTLSITRRRAQAVGRWAMVTATWVLVTQWFFGPPLIDRGFRWTGGACRQLADPSKSEELGNARQYLTAQACKLHGGQWVGGHDISGHVFLLILGSALLWMEILPTLLRARGLHEERRVRVRSGKVVTTRSIVDGTADGSGTLIESSKEDEQFTSLGVKVVVGIVALMWWMLLMTAAFFHTWLEKFTGFVVAYLVLFLIYFLPRGAPQVRAVLGMPGL